MGKKVQIYLFVRVASSCVGIGIIIANFVLWDVSPEEIESLAPGAFFLAVGLGFQSFLFTYLGFLIAQAVSSRYLNRWKDVEIKEMEIHERIIPMEDGRQLHGKIWKRDESSSNTTDMVIICYGFNDNQEKISHFARAITLAGYVVFTWDYRGVGKNDGRITDFLGHIQDMKEIMHYWVEHPVSQQQRLFACGWSLGGMVAINACLGDERVSKVFAWSTWSDLRKRVLWKIYVNPLAFFRYLFKGQLMMPGKQRNALISPFHHFHELQDRFASDGEFREFVSRKLFLCHSKKDRFISMKNFQENVEASHLKPSNYHIFEKGNHMLVKQEAMLLGFMIGFFRRW
ncbi:alpha/beta fold hydrolase [Candidatus Bathyarchaeota archaeon]|nr:alpha/beta fold hydrolase [Candidatus Bathyarchaeota archaeon]